MPKKTLNLSTLVCDYFPCLKCCMLKARRNNNLYRQVAYYTECERGLKTDTVKTFKMTQTFIAFHPTCFPVGVLVLKELRPKARHFSTHGSQTCDPVNARWKKAWGRISHKLLCFFGRGRSLWNVCWELMHPSGRTRDARCAACCLNGICWRHAAVKLTFVGYNLPSV